MADAPNHVEAVPVGGGGRAWLVYSGCVVVRGRRLEAGASVVSTLSIAPVCGSQYVKAEQTVCLWELPIAACLEEHPIEQWLPSYCRALWPGILVWKKEWAACVIIEAERRDTSILVTYAQLLEEAGLASSNDSQLSLVLYWDKWKKYCQYPFKL